MRKYNNNYNFDKLTNFEVAFLESLIDEAEREYEERKGDEDFYSKEECKVIETINFDLASLDDKTIEVGLKIAKEAEKVFKIPETDVKMFAGDLLCDLLFGSDYVREYTKEQEVFFDKYGSCKFGSPMISFSVENDFRVFII